jgi:hypothetical protein
MDREDRLWHIAEQQEGYFTSTQANDCGFMRSNFHRYVNSGKWLKSKIRGIYRLSHYPSSSSEEFAFWTLWSCNKKGSPQGVVSHETALSIHELSDVAPTKIHMSVPKKFRKREIPTNLCLHYVNEIPKSDIEFRQGYSITTPYKTLADLITANQTQLEQISMALLDYAIQNCIAEGFTTISQIEQLKKITDSKLIIDVIDRAIDTIWTRANTKLQHFGRQVEPFTICLSWGEAGFGTAILCEYKSKYVLLTATHVGRALRNSKSFRMILQFDQFRRVYPENSPKNFKFYDWDPSFTDEKLDDVIKHTPRDLCIIHAPKETIDTLLLYKRFYPIDEFVKGFSLKDALISLGGIEPIKDESTKTVTLAVGPYAFVAKEYMRLVNSDYIICPVSNHTYEMRNLRRMVIASFAGLSGAGLWKFNNDTPQLVGVAIAQDPSGYNTSGHRNVYFHGPQSILSAFSTLGNSNDD